MIQVLISEIPTTIDTLGLPVKELNRINSYKSEKKRRESLYGLSLLKESLRNNGVESFTMDYKKNHKPFLVDSKLEFNISHSKETVVCALSSNEVGIDIEYFNTKVLKVQEKFVTQEVLHNLKDLQENDRIKELTKIWVLKESFLKYLGIGISIDLTAIEIEQKNHRYYISYNNQQAQAIVFEYEAYMIALCQRVLEEITFTKRGELHEQQK